MTQDITVKCECSSCSGTGLYVGMGERDGAAVICFRCKGSGKSKITYRPFEGRKSRIHVKRVFATNPGVVLAPDVTPGGVRYDGWLDGTLDPREPGCEAREHSCPLLWYQSADDTKKPEWRACAGYGESIRACPSYAFRSLCWAEWDKENKR